MKYHHMYYASYLAGLVMCMLSIFYEDAFQLCMILAWLAFIHGAIWRLK